MNERNCQFLVSGCGLLSHVSMFKMIKSVLNTLPSQHPLKHTIRLFQKSHLKVVLNTSIGKDGDGTGQRWMPSGGRDQDESQQQSRERERKKKPSQTEVLRDTHEYLYIYEFRNMIAF